jgi:hypothetical protein
MLSPPRGVFLAPPAYSHSPALMLCCFPAAVSRFASPASAVLAHHLRPSPCPLALTTAPSSRAHAGHRHQRASPARTQAGGGHSLASVAVCPRFSCDSRRFLTAASAPTTTWPSSRFQQSRRRSALSTPILASATAQQHFWHPAPQHRRTAAPVIAVTHAFWHPAPQHRRTAAPVIAVTHALHRHPQRFNSPAFAIARLTPLPQDSSSATGIRRRAALLPCIPAAALVPARTVALPPRPQRAYSRQHRPPAFAPAAVLSRLRPLLRWLWRISPPCLSTPPWLRQHSPSVRPHLLTSSASAASALARPVPPQPQHQLTRQQYPRLYTRTPSAPLAAPTRLQHRPRTSRATSPHLMQPRRSNLPVAPTPRRQRRGTPCGTTRRFAA